MNAFKVVNFKLNYKIIPGLYFLFSWIVVAWGQPARSPLLGVLTSFLGYLLFWEGLFFFDTKKVRFWISVFWFMAVEAIHLSWMISTEYQGFYIYSIYVFVLFAIGLQFGLLSLFLKKGSELTFKRIFLIASLWVWMEWLRLFFICGFPFNPVGLSLSSTNAGMQGASLMGIYGLTFWVMLTNLIGYKCVHGFKKNLVALYALCILSPYLFGLVNIAYHEKRINSSKECAFKTLLVQTALNPKEKTGFKGFENMIPPIDQWAFIYNYLVDYKDQNIDLIVLPERTVPLSHNEPHYLLKNVQVLVSSYFGKEALEFMPKLDQSVKYVDNVYISQILANYFDAGVIVGLEHAQVSEPDFFVGNASAFYFSKDKPYQMYHKRILLPLVEYIPFEWCKKLARRYNIYGWYERGDKPVVFDGAIKVSPSICMEEMYPFIVREGRKHGAELFANITNDVWYPNSKLPKQHFDHGALRAVENGVPLVRSCNTGITGAVDSLGRKLGSLKAEDGSFQWEKGALYIEVPKYHYQTLYAYFGDWLVLSLSGLLMFVFLVNFRIRLRYQKKQVGRGLSF